MTHRPAPASAGQIRRAAEDAAAAFPALMIDAERVAHAVASGLHGRRRAGPGETFWQHRAYTFGDPVSAIDWRQSARAADRLYVRQNEWEAAAAVWIWRDPTRSLDYACDPNLPTKRRRADVLAVALAILLAQAGERIGLIGARERPFHGRAAPALFLEALTAETFAESGARPPPAKIAAGARIVLLSDFFAEPDETASIVAGYAAEGARGALAQIVDPAEEDFPFIGRAEFEDLESRDRLLFGETGAIAGDYRAHFAAHRRALEDICRRYGWTFIAHRTDRPAQTALLALFMALGDPGTLK
ncbi:MAG: DUF58 domain-containing protein [Amphiplicatus sp.]